MLFINTRFIPPSAGLVFGVLSVRCLRSWPFFRSHRILRKMISPTCSGGLAHLSPAELSCQRAVQNALRVAARRAQPAAQRRITAERLNDTFVQVIDHAFDVAPHGISKADHSRGIVLKRGDQQSQRCDATRSYAGLRQFRVQGYGGLINIASVDSEVPLASEAVYSATKAGVLSLAGTLNQQIRLSGRSRTIHVVTIMPCRQTRRYGSM
jgi:hypothetical protein